MFCARERAARVLRSALTQCCIEMLRFHYFQQFSIAMKTKRANSVVLWISGFVPLFCHLSEKEYLLVTWNFVTVLFFLGSLTLYALRVLLVLDAFLSLRIWSELTCMWTEIETEIVAILVSFFGAFDAVVLFFFSSRSTLKPICMVNCNFTQLNYKWMVNRVIQFANCTIWMLLIRWIPFWSVLHILRVRLRNVFFFVVSLSAAKSKRCQQFMETIWRVWISYIVMMIFSCEQQSQLHSLRSCFEHLLHIYGRDSF